VQSVVNTVQSDRWHSKVIGGIVGYG
jgi:hypothetical protein